MINVNDRGIFGNTDKPVTDKLKLLFDEIASTGADIGEKVFFPTGKYILDGSVKVHGKYISITGEGPSTLFVLNNSAAGFVLGDCSGSTATNCVMSEIRFYRNNNEDRAGSAITVKYAAWIVLSNIQFFETAVAISLGIREQAIGVEPTQHVRVLNCIIQGGPVCGIDILNGSNYYIDHCDVIGQSAIQIQDRSNAVVIANCNIVNGPGNYNVGVYIVGTPFCITINSTIFEGAKSAHIYMDSKSSDPKNGNLHNVRISDCWLGAAPGAKGIHLNGLNADRSPRQIYISDNRINDVGVAIESRYAYDLIVTGNECGPLVKIRDGNNVLVTTNTFGGGLEIDPGIPTKVVRNNLGTNDLP